MFRSRHLVLWSLGTYGLRELGKGLVVQREDTSPPVHPTEGKLHCCLIIFLSLVSICWSRLWFKVDLSS
jgi:hypothetical protein